MTRKEVKELLPIIQAYAEGKSIEISSITDVSKAWREVTDFPLGMIDSFKFRIKPEPKYRPFKDAEECWNEMLKHQPFGVVKDKYYAKFQVHRSFTTLLVNGCNFRGYEDSTFLNNFKNLLFADGTPFGVKVEE